MSKRILAINPGSTSTKVALYDDLTLIGQVTIRHSIDELGQYPTLQDQLPLRTQAVLDLLTQKKIELSSIDAIVGRGGLLHPLPQGGTYAINEEMLDDLRVNRYGVHASNLGALIAHQLSQLHHQPCFIVNPVVVDEMIAEARVTGIPGIQRASRYHALNQKAIAHRFAKELHRRYEELTLVITHLGGGISVGLHRNGRTVDVNNALGGDGPFSPERAGTTPLFDLVNLCFSGLYTREQIYSMLVGKGGLAGHLGTADGREIVARIEQGDSHAESIMAAMCYQVAKEIGSLVAVAQSEIDGVILTGGLAYNDYIVSTIKHYLPSNYPIYVFPGEDELLALVEGTLAVLNGEVCVLSYNT